MQIYFYTSKKNFIELFEWIKTNFKNLNYYDNRKNKCFNEQEVYNGIIGYTRQIILTDEKSMLSEKMKLNNFDFIEEKYPFIWKSGIELTFGYSDDEIYRFDFSSYNPYDKKINEPFYRCRFYLDSFYLSNNEMYKSIFQKICKKIRKDSIHINGEYVKDYLYNGKIIWR